MILRVTTGAFAAAAAATHSDADEMKSISVDGPFLVFDFSHCESLEEARESIRTMDVFLAGLIADEDEPAEIAALSALKSAVIAIETDVQREYVYKTRAQNTVAEASDDTAQSHYASDTHAASEDSSNSNGAETTDEESLSNEQAQPQQQEERPRRRKR